MSSGFSFVIRNIFKGIILLVLFVGIYLISKKYLNPDFFRWLEPIYDNLPLVLLIFLLSEVFIGIIPPEIFIIWALRDAGLKEFLLMIGVLSLISYSAGILGYFIGHYLNVSRFYRIFKRRFLKKLDQRLKIFGMYLIIIAALTPLPFSGVSMLIGSVRYPFKKFILLSLTRFLRFALYAYIFWQVKV